MGLLPESEPLSVITTVLMTVSAAVGLGVTPHPTRLGSECLGRVTHYQREGRAHGVSKHKAPSRPSTCFVEEPRIYLMRLSAARSSYLPRFQPILSPVLRAVLGAVLLCVLTLGSSHVDAQELGTPADQAGEDYAAGVELFRHGEFGDAAALFERAYRLDSTAVLAFNAGRSWHREGSLERARQWYEVARSTGDSATVAASSVALEELRVQESTRVRRRRALVGAALLAVSAGSLALGVTSASRARGAHWDARNALTEPAFERSVSEGRRARNVSNVAWVGALASATVGGRLLLTQPDRDWSATVAAAGLGFDFEVRF